MARLKTHAKKKPTKVKEVILLKHRILLKKISENVRKGMTMEQAMTSVGYSPSYATSAHLKATDSWQKLLEQTFPDSFISEQLMSHAKAKQVRQMYFHYKLKDGEIQKFIEDEGFKFVSTKRFMTTAVVFFTAPDFIAQEKAIEKLLKLKRKYGDITIKHKFGESSDSEIEDAIAGEVSEAFGLEEGADTAD